MAAAADITAAATATGAAIAGVTAAVRSLRASSADWRLGALAGAAIANSQPAPGYYGYGGGPPACRNIYGADPNWVNYCASKYRSFDPRSGTYLASDGYRYPCQ
jgi:hypothetical protein